MATTEKQLTETHVLGPKTQEWRVPATECPGLANYHIAHVGIADAAAPYEMVRMDLGGTYLLACFGGRGRILLDGRWQTIRAGQACLAPPHVQLAFKAAPDSRWQFAWVRYSQPADQKPIISSSSPAMAKFDSEPLHHAIHGLWHEMKNPVTPTSIVHWVELVQGYVARFAQPWQTDERLSNLWEYVAARLGEHWTLEQLAGRCNLSTEHLRRLCRRELGRSPMHQVIYLRMQLAAQILATTDQKIESVAKAVGYENPFVFSTTFKKWVGWRPSVYRQKHR